MKKNKLILFIFISLFIVLNINTKENKPVLRVINDEECKNMNILFVPAEIVKEQSFLLNFGKYKDSYFITVINLEEQNYSFYIVKKGEIIYEFPEAFTYEAYMDNIAAVSFPDIYNDGNIDVVVIIDCMTGIGPDGAIPFPVVTVYFNDGKDFFNRDENIDMELTDKYNNGKNIKSIKDIVIYLNKSKK